MNKLKTRRAKPLKSHWNPFTVTFKTADGRTLSWVRSGASAEDVREYTKSFLDYDYPGHTVVSVEPTVGGER
jgi:hypothetical protein